MRVQTFMKPFSKFSNGCLWWQVTFSTEQFFVSGHQCQFNSALFYGNLISYKKANEKLFGNITILNHELIKYPNKCVVTTAKCTIVFNFKSYRFFRGVKSGLKLNIINDYYLQKLNKVFPIGRRVERYTIVLNENNWYVCINLFTFFHISTCHHDGGVLDGQ